MRIVSPSSIPLDGKVYIHATDTCYGFAARWDDEEGIRLIQELKNRGEQKPMSLLFSDITMLEAFCEIHQEQMDFIVSQNLPSSFLLKKKAILKDYFPEQENVSARIENDLFPVKLSSLLNTPVTSTSVNRSGKNPLYNTDNIAQIFQEASDEVVLIDSGEIPKIPPSNIWDLTQSPYVKIR